MKRIFFVLLLCSSLFAQQKPAALKPYTLDTMFLDTGKDAAPQGTQWSPDGSKLSFVRRGEGAEQQSLWYFDPASGKPAQLVAADKLGGLNEKPPTSGKGDDRAADNRKRYGVAAYHWSPDSKSILFDTNGRLYLYDLASNTGAAITTTGESAVDPQFSPDGRTISFVNNHNLYIRHADQPQSIALTRDGNENLYNGDVDWLYLEELDVRSNYFWSPDSKQILFLQSNETPVGTYPIVDWIQKLPSVYPEKYPKTGMPNPIARLGVSDLNGQVRFFELTQDTNTYIPRFGWVTPGIAWAMVLNRKQDHADLYLINTSTGAKKIVLTEQDDRYIEITNSIHFFKSGDRFIWPSWRDGFTHLYLYSLDAADPLAADAKLVRQLEKGPYEVAEVEDVDEQNGTVYFMANKTDDMDEQLFSVSVDGGAVSLVSAEPGSHNVTMAPNTRYYVDTFSTLTKQPRMQICAVAQQRRCNEIWASHIYDGYDTIAPQRVDFKAEDGTLLHGVLILPSAQSTAKNGKFPLVMNPYGGPHGTIRNTFSSLTVFDQILAHRGIAVLKVDNRGGGNRGKKFATATFHNLYEIELRDQLAALDQAIAKYPIDRQRLGWWGWSYGGSMTLWALTHSDRFKVGVSVAPVTNWLYYDTAYTERYMGMPQENEAAYKKTAIVNYAANLKGNLLLVHGTSDDNVHLQNSMEMVNAFIDNGVQFNLQLYPQKTHAISGKKTRMHLYSRILSHLENGLK